MNEPCERSCSCSPSRSQVAGQVRSAWAFTDWGGLGDPLSECPLGCGDSEQDGADREDGDVGSWTAADHREREEDGEDGEAEAGHGVERRSGVGDAEREREAGEAEEAVAGSEA